MTLIVSPRVHDLGGFQVRRAVPSIQARSVGPFVFVDHMGPAVFEVGRGIDVRPHPHIGLATVTFLWSGTITHRDTLGSLQDINPGDVNWMTAGRGIAHSERTPTTLREHEHPLHGMQTWVALPRSDEEAEPGFFHHPAATLPQQRRDGSWLRVVAGRGYGEESPVRVYADTLYVAIDLDADAELALDDSHPRTRPVRAGRRRPARRRRHPGDAPGGARPGHPPQAARAHAGEGHAARRGAAGCPAPPVVELRVQSRRSGSSRPSRTGRRGGSARSPATTSSSPCPSVEPRLLAARPDRPGSGRDLPDP